MSAPPGAAATDDPGAVRECLRAAFDAITQGNETELAPLVYSELIRQAEWDFYDGEPGRLVVEHWREWWPKETPQADDAEITLCGDLAYALAPAPLGVGADLYYQDMDTATLAVVLARVRGKWQIAGMTYIMSSSDPETLPAESRDRWVRGREYLRADLSLASRLMRTNPAGVLANTHSVVVRAPVSGGLQVVRAEDFTMGRMETPAGLEGEWFSLPPIRIPENAEVLMRIGLTNALFAAKAEEPKTDGPPRPLYWVMLLEWWPECARWKIPLLAVVSADPAQPDTPAGRGDGTGGNGV